MIQIFWNKRLKGTNCDDEWIQSWRLALVEYLAMALDSNAPSPSELNGHKFNSLLPNVSTSSSKHSDTSHHVAQFQHNKRGHTLPELPGGSKVGYRNHSTNQFNIGIISDRNSRSYTICTESGTNISRNCIDLKQTDTPFESQPQPVISKFANSMHATTPNNPNNANTKANFKSSIKAKLPGKGIDVRDNVCVTHSGHMSKPTARLIASM